MQFPRIDALLRHGAQALLHAVLDLAFDEGFGHREIVRVHQFVHDLVLGLLLRLVLALGEDGLADGFPEFVHGAVVAEFLGELVVEFGQFLAAQALEHGVELHGLAGQLLGAVILGVGDFEILLVAGSEAAQILGEGLEGVLGADFEHHLVGLHRFAFDACQAFQRDDGEIAVLHRARVDIDVLRLLLADLVDALGDVLVGDFGILVGHFDVGVLAERDFREDFEGGLELAAARNRGSGRR